jgi:hypothetical protein
VTRPTPEWQRRLDAYILRHRLAVGVGLGLALLLMYDSIMRIRSDVPEFGIMGWVALASCFYAAWVNWFLPRRLKTPAREMVSLLLGTDMSPFAFGAFSVSAGGPSWVMTLGLLTSAVLVVGLLVVVGNPAGEPPSEAGQHQVKDQPSPSGN